MFKNEFCIKVIETFKKAKDNKIMITTDKENYYIEKSYYNNKEYYYCEELNIINPKFFNLLTLAEYIYSLFESKNIKVLGIYH
ncbi:MAG: hypothetical protein PHT02_01090 [Tissierellia bacterium]|nr:hypothetical protein [Tissierellia bacterium]